MLQRLSRPVLAMVMVTAALSGCHATPLVSPTGLSAVSGQAYMPPGGGSTGPNYPHNPSPYYPVNPSPNYPVHPNPYYPVNPTPNTGHLPGGGTSHCYPHVPCM